MGSTSPEKKNMKWAFGNFGWRNSDNCFCRIQSKELKHWIFRLGESPYPTRYRLPPSHQPSSWRICWKNNDLPKIQRFHAHPKLFKSIQHVFKTMFGLIGFTYVLNISAFQRFINIPPSFFVSSKRPKLKIVLAHENTQKCHSCVLSVPNISKFCILRMISIEVISAKYVPIFLILLNQFGIFKSINKGSHGSINPEIMERLGFGLSHKQIEKL